MSARESKFLHALVDVGARLGVSALAAYRDREPEFGPGTRRGVACLVGGGSGHPPLGKVLGPIPVPNNGTNEMVTVMDGTSAGMTRVTHPFHPWSWREFVFVAVRHTWAEDRVFFLDAEGGQHALPVGWTDTAGPDVFVTGAAGLCPFNVADLVALARLAEGCARHEHGRRRVRGSDQRGVRRAWRRSQR